MKRKGTTVSIYVRKEIFDAGGRAEGELNIIHDHGLLIFFSFQNENDDLCFIPGVNENWGFGTNGIQLFY